MENQKRESFIFYLSFYEAIQTLSDKERLRIYDAICELGLNGNEVELKGIAKTLFILMKPQIISNNKKYKNGKKGGRPRKTTVGNDEEKTYGFKNKETTGYSEKKPNVNDNENDNVNENVNDNDNDNVNENENVFGLFETEFKRPLSSSEMKRLADFIESYGEGRVTDALRQAIIYNKKNLNYIERILQNAVIEQYESY